jgi:hypothetical protein
MRFKTCRFSWFAAFWSSTSGVVGMVPASLLPLCSHWHGLAHSEGIGAQSVVTQSRSWSADHNNARPCYQAGCAFPIHAKRSSCTKEPSSALFRRPKRPAQQAVLASAAQQPEHARQQPHRVTHRALLTRSFSSSSLSCWQQSTAAKQSACAVSTFGCGCMDPNMHARRVNFQLLERFVGQRVTLVGRVRSCAV